MSFYGEWAEFYDLIYDDIKKDIPFYLEYAKLKGSPVLEIACGTGRVLIPIAEAGFEIWGIDSSSSMLEKAQEKVSVLSEKVKKKIHLVQSDMRNFQLNQQFNLVIIPFRSFLLLLSVKDQIQTLKNIHKHMEKNGVLIVDIFAPKYDYLVNERRQNTKETMIPGNNKIIRTDDIVYDHTHQRTDEQISVEQYNEKGELVRTYQGTLKMRYVFRYEMEHLLKLSGFKLEELYGTYDKKPYDYKFGEMIFIASRA